MSVTDKICECQIRARRSGVDVFAPKAISCDFDTVADVSQTTIDTLAALPLQLPRPAKPVPVYLITAPQRARWYDLPLLEEREMMERSAYVYLPPNILRRQGWQHDLRYIVARAVLRNSRPDPTERGVTFEEALALFACEQPRVLTDGEPMVSAREPLDSPRNVGGALALLEYVWMEMGSHFLRKLWDRGEDGIVHALDRTCAKSVSEILRSFFLWAAEHGLLEEMDASAQFPRTHDTLDHASYWLGSPPAGSHLDLLKGRGGTHLYAYLLDPGGTTPRGLPCKSTVTTPGRLVVVNCGHRMRGTFPSHDGVKWTVQAEAAVRPPRGTT